MGGLGGVSQTWPSGVCGAAGPDRLTFQFHRVSKLRNCSRITAADWWRPLTFSAPHTPRGSAKLSAFIPLLREILMLFCQAKRCVKPDREAPHVLLRLSSSGLMSLRPRLRSHRFQDNKLTPSLSSKLILAPITPEWM